jgi:hypothetical protein
LKIENSIPFSIKINDVFPFLFQMSVFVLAVKLDRFAHPDILKKTNPANKKINCFMILGFLGYNIALAKPVPLFLII